MSAVMKSLDPLDPLATPDAASPASHAAVAAPAQKPAARVRPAGTPWRLRLRMLAGVVLPPVLGMAFLVLIWQIVSVSSSGIPSPLATLDEAVKIFSDPFYSKSPNDQGIGWNLLASLQRVAVGFGLAAAVGIPAGFLIGRFRILAAMFNPIISILKPVSPLAWLPIGLLVFKAANPASIWAIFICSIWRMLPGQR